MNNGVELADLRRGKSRAWRVVHEHVRRAAASFRLDLAEEWEDAVQEAEIRLLRALREKRFSDEPHLQAYAWRITRNVCVDQLRRRRVRSTQPLEAIAEPPAPRRTSPLTAAERAEQRAQISLLLSLLPEPCRELLLLLRRGRSYSELAWQMGTSPGALRVRAHRCRQRARARLARMRTPIAGAAWRLFRERGFVETPLSAIAEIAGRTVAEVEAIYRSKADLLWDIASRLVTGAGGVSVQESDFVRALRAAADPARRVRLAARWSAGYRARGLSDLEAVVYRAGRASTRCRRLVRQMLAMRQAMGRQVVGLITEGLRQREGITTDNLLKGVWTIENGMTYRRMVGAGLSRDEYGDWLETELSQRLLP